MAISSLHCDATHESRTALTLNALKREVSALRDPERAKFLAGFFRTGPGEYAEGDKLLADRHDLIHKATGWLLREAGKVEQAAMLAFLRTHYPRLPRTALRYSIERLDLIDRKLWLAGPQ